jgi:hypothetical protein
MGKYSIHQKETLIAENISSLRMAALMADSVCHELYPMTVVDSGNYVRYETALAQFYKPNDKKFDV